MKKISMIATILFLFACSALTHAAGIVAGAAPKGDPTVVAKRIIKTNFPTCGRVLKGIRLADGSIRANCGTDEFRVFTVFNAKEGKTVELAMNCTVMKVKMNVSCF